MRKRWFLPYVAAIIFLVVVAVAAPTPSKAANNTPPVFKAFSHVRLTVQAPKKAVAQSLAIFTLTLHNPTHMTFRNVRMMLVGLQDQSKQDLVHSSVVPLKTNASITLHQGQKYILWMVYKLRPGETKTFVLGFGIHREIRTKQVCLHIGANISVPATGQTSKPHNAAACAPYRQS